MKSASRPVSKRATQSLSFLDGLIVLSVTAGLILFCTLYTNFRLTDLKSHLETDARSELRYYAAKLETHMRARLNAAQRIRAAWLEGFVDGANSYARLAQTEISLFDDLQAINWVSPDGLIAWVNPPQGNRPALGLDIMKVPHAREALIAARESGDVQMTPPIELAQGGTGTVAYLPIALEGNSLGYVNVVFRYERLIGGGLAMPDDIEDIRVIVTDGSDEIFRSRLPAGKPKSISVEMTLEVANREWTVRLEYGQPEFYEHSVREVWITLIAGIIGSITIGFLVAAVLMSLRSLRKSEHRLADFAAASSDWFWEADPECRFTSCSDRFYSLTGLTPSQVLGRSLSEINRISLNESTQSRMLAAIDRRESFKHAELERITDDGNRLHLTVSGVPAFGSDGSFMGYRGVGSDVTERWRFEDQLATALREAEKANHAKSRFLATLSHELRTPMNAILGFSDFLQGGFFGPINERYRSYAKDIHSSGQHLLALIDDLLNYSTLEAGERRLTPEPVDVGNNLRELFKTIAPTAAEKGIGLDITLHPDPLIIEADARSFTQVATNILTNAVKFTGTGGQVRVAVAPLGDGVEIVFSDTGIGIATHEIEKALEPFSQVEGNNGVSQEGTGLGLAIVKGLVEVHQGHLRIESEVGRGTKVRVWFPRNFRGPLSAPDRSTGP